MDDQSQQPVVLIPYSRSCPTRLFCLLESHVVSIDSCTSSATSSAYLLLRQVDHKHCTLPRTCTSHRPPSQGLTLQFTLHLQHPPRFHHVPALQPAIASNMLAITSFPRRFPTASKRPLRLTRPAPSSALTRRPSFRLLSPLQVHCTTQRSSFSSPTDRLSRHYPQPPPSSQLSAFASSAASVRDDIFYDGDDLFLYGERTDEWFTTARNPRTDPTFPGVTVYPAVSVPSKCRTSALARAVNCSTTWTTRGS